MPYDYSKLAGRIVEKFGTRREFSKAIGLSEHSVSMKMTGKTSWKQEEITRACRVLNLSDTEIAEHFFALKVQY